MEIGMGNYIIENLDLFLSMKYLGCPKILFVEVSQWYAFLLEGHQWCDNSGDEMGYCFIMSILPSPEKSIISQVKNDMGKLFTSPFIYKYMIESCKCKGGG